MQYKIRRILICEGINLFPSIALLFNNYLIITLQLPRTRSASGGKVIGTGVHIYIYVCGRKKYLNCTLAIDSRFQTLAVGFLVEFID